MKIEEKCKKCEGDIVDSHCATCYEVDLDPPQEGIEDDQEYPEEDVEDDQEYPEEDYDIFDSSRDEVE